MAFMLVVCICHSHGQNCLYKEPVVNCKSIQLLKLITQFFKCLYCTGASVIVCCPNGSVDGLHVYRHTYNTVLNVVATNTIYPTMYKGLKLEFVHVMF